MLIENNEYVEARKSMPPIPTLAQLKAANPNATNAGLFVIRILTALFIAGKAWKGYADRYNAVSCMDAQIATDIITGTPRFVGRAVSLWHCRLPQLAFVPPVSDSLFPPPSIREPVWLPLSL